MRVKPSKDKDPYNILQGDFGAAKETDDAELTSADTEEPDTFAETQLIVSVEELDEDDWFDKSATEFHESTQLLGPAELSNEFDETQIITPDIAAPLSQKKDEFEPADPAADFVFQIDEMEESGLLMAARITSKISESDEAVNKLRRARINPAEPKQKKAPADHTQVTAGATPISRFLARGFDLSWQLLLLHSVFNMFLANPLTSVIPTLTQDTVLQNILLQLGLAILLLPVVLLLDSLVFAIFGNTPGKALLGLKMMEPQQKKIGFLKYLSRNIRLWASGLAFGIPPLNLATMARQRTRLIHRKPASYDRKSGLVVAAPAKGFGKTAAFVLASLALLLVTSATVLPDTVQEKAWALFDSAVKTVNTRSFAPTKHVEVPPRVIQPKQVATIELVQQPSVVDSSPSIQPLSVTKELAEAPVEEKPADVKTDEPPPAEKIPEARIASIPALIPERTAAQSSGSQPVAGMQSWENPVTELSTDINQQWLYTTEPSGWHRFNWSTAADPIMSVTLRPDDSSHATLKAAAQDYLAKTDSRIDFQNSPVTYRVGDNEFWEVEGRSVASGSVSLHAQIGKINNAYWILEITDSSPDDKLKSEAQKLSASLWATL